LVDADLVDRTNNLLDPDFSIDDHVRQSELLGLLTDTLQPIARASESLDALHSSTARQILLDRALVRREAWPLVFGESPPDYGQH